MPSPSEYLTTSRDFRNKNLPDKCYSPFAVHRLKSFVEIWKSEAAPENWHPADYACITPTPENQSLLQSTALIALAEHYGGAGVGSNGGGVRCGNINNFQIKGIGRNHLAGRGTDYWHKHGSASVQDCVKEAIWSQIVASALPFGAAQALSVIDTQTTFEAIIDETKERILVPRGLFVRESVVRPAHFMRSGFVDLGEPRLDQANDVQRTREAINYIPFLAGIENTDDASTSFLNQIFEAAAKQLARARALRLIHGSHIPSNYSVDGKWLDFGTMTATSGYAPAIVAPGADDSWTQQRAILEAIDDFVFYVYKYSGQFARNACKHIAGRIKERFDVTYKKTSVFEFCKLTGLSDLQIESLPGEILANLWSAIGAILVAQQRGKYLYFGDMRHRMPEPDRELDLNAILMSCAMAKDEAEVKNNYRTAAALRLIDAVFSVRQYLTSEQLFAPGWSDAGVAFRCALLNQPNHNIQRCNLDNAIDKAVRSGDDLGLLIAETSAPWARALDYRNSAHINLECWGGGARSYIDSLGRAHLGDVAVDLKTLQQKINSHCMDWFTSVH